MTDKPVIASEAKQSLPPLPPGKVRLTSGEIVDRANVCFRFMPDKADPTLFRALDGHIYMKEKSGALRRMTYKKGERRTYR